jgi:hypothetical protein
MAEGVKADEDVLTDAPVQAPVAPGPGGVEEMVDQLEAERDEAFKQLRIARSWLGPMSTGWSPTGKSVLR